MNLLRNMNVLEKIAIAISVGLALISPSVGLMLFSIEEQSPLLGGIGLILFIATIFGLIRIVKGLE